MTARKPLGALLVESGRVTPAQVEEALETQRSGGPRRPLGQILLDRGAIDDEALARALAEQVGVPFVDPGRLEVDPVVLWRIPRKLAEQYSAFAWRREAGGFRVAVADPDNENLRKDLEYLLGGPVRFDAAPRAKLRAAVHRHYDLEPTAQRMLEGIPAERRAPVTSPTALELDAGAIETRLGRGGSAYVDLLNFLLVNAIERGASDIHMEPDPDGMRVRMRIDGMLREALRLPPWAILPITNRIKVVAEMDIAERRRALDGRASAELGKRRVDLRVSMIPNQYGQTIVIRILDSRTVRAELGSLGWGPRGLASWFHIVSQPQGLVLVVGPTGSGKSTTLYASINRLRSESTSIVTVEDPIEHTIAGVNQVQVDEARGLTFARVARTLLRQDPNIMVIGEVRDADSAAAAMEVATTGHLVLTTLHAGTAVAAVTRMRDLEVPDSLLGSALIGVVAQRLVRRVCQVCSELVEPTPEEWERLGIGPFPLGSLARRVGAGCPSCQYAGYSGRLGVFEVLEIDDAVRAGILAGEAERELLARAIEAGFSPFLDDALEKCRQGLTTLEEVARVVPVDGTRSRRRASMASVPPAEIAPKPAPAEPAPPPEVKANPAGARRRILVADDAEEILQLVGATLEDDYDLVFARDGQEALDRVGAERPDAVVLDVMMPRMSGYDVCRVLKERDPDLPVLILSARGDTGHVKEGFHSGADDYLPKPFDPEELELRLRALLRRAGRR
jgi:type IV pilus assembly protein PilB